METNTSPSFIPKRPVVSNAMPGQKKTKSKGKKFQSFAVLIFFLVAISYGGLFFYGNSISSSINDLEIELADLERNLDMEDIDKLLRFESKLISSQELLNRHIAVSTIFKMFEDSTVSLVQFTDFSMAAPKNKPATLSIKGQAGSYSTIALQEKAFMGNKYTETISFSNFNLNELGKVTFGFQGVFSPAVVSFREKITNLLDSELLENLEESDEIGDDILDLNELIPTEEGGIDTNNI